MNSESNSPSLTANLDTVSGAFLILGFGLGISVLAFSVEFLISHWKKKKLSKKIKRKTSTRRPSEISPYSGRVVTTSFAPRFSDVADLKVEEIDADSVTRRPSVLYSWSSCNSRIRIICSYAQNTFQCDVKDLIRKNFMHIYLTLQFVLHLWIKFYMLYHSIGLHVHLYKPIDKVGVDIR